MYKIWDEKNLIEPSADNTPEYMFNYCIQGVDNNCDINQAGISDWADGYHVASVYLADIKEVPESVIEALDIWLNGAKTAEYWMNRDN